MVVVICGDDDFEGRILGAQCNGDRLKVLDALREYGPCTTRGLAKCICLLYTSDAADE